MMVPYQRLIYWWDGRGLMLWLLSGPPGFTCWISFAPVFSFMYCWVLIFALSPFYILICMFWGMMHRLANGLSCKPNIHVSWLTSELRVRSTPSSKHFFWQFQGGTSLVDHLCFFLSCVWYAFLRACLFVPCGHLLGKGWPLLSRLWCLTLSLSHTHWYPGSGVVFDCINSWSLHLYLLTLITDQ